MLLFGDFYLKEDRSDADSGSFVGKFRIQTNKNVENKSEFSTLTFKADGESYAGMQIKDVWWASFIPKDISKVIFK